MSETCNICNKLLDFIVDTNTNEAYAVPIGDGGLIVPNSYVGEWAGCSCCKECFDIHQLWSQHFMYYEYMIKDGRLELSYAELVEYGRDRHNGCTNAETTENVEISPRI